MKLDKNIHTIVMSDLHLSDAEPVIQDNPLWKKFRQKQHFIDKDFEKFLVAFDTKINAPIELVLNGDIFDFDSVMSLPNENEIKYSSHEKKRGLGSSEKKSTFKIQKILEDHKLWIDALTSFLKKGNKVIFVIGNHDVELHWPKVQKTIISMMNLPLELERNVVFCEWFYISNNDTLIEHGNQYDPYCVCIDPVNPTVLNRKSEIIRLPFGNLANKYLVNGMGLKNPHDDSAFIMSAMGFVRFFLKYELKVQPFLFWTWLTGAIRTLFVYTKQSWLPSLRDPLTLELKIEKMAKKAQTSVRNLRIAREFHAHPAAFKPFTVLRELWLDRALFLLLIFGGSFQFFSTTNLIVDVSFWWFFIPFIITLPFFALYARGVSSDVRAHAQKSEEKIYQVAKAIGVSRIIQGHTHRLVHKYLQGVEFINTGSWTPVFHDPECTKPYGKMPFAWIQPAELDGRESFLYLFQDGEFKIVRQSEEQGKSTNLANSNNYILKSVNE